MTTVLYLQFFTMFLIYSLLVYSFIQIVFFLAMLTSRCLINGPAVRITGLVARANEVAGANANIISIFEASCGNVEIATKSMLHPMECPLNSRRKKVGSFLFQNETKSARIKITDINQFIAFRLGENEVQYGRNIKFPHFVPTAIKKKFINLFSSNILR